MEITKTFLDKIKQLSLKCNESSDIEEAMRCVMKSTTTRLQAIYVKDYLRTLIEKKLGTPAVYP